MEFSRKVKTAAMVGFALMILLIGLVILPEIISGAQEGNLSGDGDIVGDASIVKNPVSKSAVLGAFGVMMGLAFIYYMVYPTMFRYDLGSTVAYCRRRLGPDATDKEISACVERREDLEDLRSRR